MEGGLYFEEPERFVGLKKWLKRLAILSALVAGIYISLCLYFMMLARDLNQQSDEFFYKRRPDLIAVFTGDAGRIQFAIEKSVELKQPNLFITGVYSKNTVNSIIKAHGIPTEINTMHLELDYLAQNTLENVIFTYRFLLSRKDLKSILVVSHDYHIPRVKMIFDKLKGKDKDLEFFYSGVKTNYMSFRNLKVLAKEVFKSLRTYTLLLLWDPNIEEADIKAPML